MKVIFLDHDYVICLSSEWGGRYKKQKEWGGRTKSLMSLVDIPIEYRFDDFNKKAISVLNEILEITGAEIVVSSDWREWATLDEMGEYYLSQGIIKKPIAFTPSINDCSNYDETFPWDKQWDLEQTRSLEIKQYLQDNPRVTNWVAVDDLPMAKTAHKEWGLDNFVWTTEASEGINQIGLKNQIVKLLNN